MPLSAVTTGTDVFDFTGLGSSNDTVAGQSNGFTAGDYFDGGGGNNSLELLFGGTFDLRVVGTILNFQVLFADGNNAEIYNKDGLNIAVTLTAPSDTFHGGSGSETISFSGTADWIDGGDGDDTVVVTSTSTLGSGATLQGGNGNDLLRVIPSGTINIAQLAGFSGFESIQLGSGNDTLIIKNSYLTGITSIDGGAGTNTLVNTDTSFDFVSLAAGTTINNFTVLRGGTAGTTFTVRLSQTASGAGAISAITGTGTGNIWLTDETTHNSTGVTLTNIQTLQSSAAGATFIVKNAQLTAGGGSVTAITGTGTGNSLRTINETSLNVHNVTLTAIQSLEGYVANTTFTVDSSQLAASSGSVATVKGTGTGNTLATADTTFNVSSTTLTAIQTLTGNTAGTTFTVKNSQLAGGSGPVAAVTATGSGNTLQTADTTFNVVGTALTAIQTLKSTTTGTTITVSNNQLSGNSGGTVTAITGTGTNSLATADTTFNVGGVTLTNIQTLNASTIGTTITIDATQSFSAITANGAGNTLKTAGTALNVGSTTLTNIQELSSGTAGTTFTVKNGQLTSGGGTIAKVTGTGTGNALVTGNTTLNVSSITLTNIQTLQSTAAGTSFILDSAGVGSVKAVTATGTGNSLRAFSGTDLNLGGVTLTNVQTLSSNSAGTTFTIDGGSLAGGGGSVATVTATGAGNTIAAGTTALNVASTTLTNIQALSSGTAGTTFTVKNAQLAPGGGAIATVTATGAGNTLATGDTSLDVASGVTLTNIQTLKTTTSGTTVTLANSQLTGGGGTITAITGTGTTTVKTANTTLNLAGVTLTNVSGLNGTTAGTTFTVDSATGLNSIVATGTGNTLKAGGTALDLSGATVSNIQALTSTQAGATITVKNAQLAPGGGAIATVSATGAGNTLATGDTSLNIASGVTLTNIQTLKTTTSGTTITLANSQLTGGGGAITAITGTGTTTVKTADTTLNLAGVTLTNVSGLTGTTAGTTFTVDAATGLNSIVATGTGNTLKAGGTALDVSGATVSNIQALTSTQAGATITVKNAQLAPGGGAIATVSATGAGNTLATGDTSLNIASGVTLTNIQTLKTTTSGTTVTLANSQLTGGGGTITAITGTGTTTVKTANTTLNLAGVTLSNVSGLNGTTTGTSFTVDAVTGLTSIVATGTNNVLKAGGAALNLSGVTTTNLQTVQATGTAVAITDNASTHTILGSAGNDVIVSGGGNDTITGGGGDDIFRDTAANLSGATITDFAAGDTINLTDVLLTGATASYTAGTLTIKNGGTTVTLSMTGTFDNNFTLASDGGTGINITYGGVRPPDAPSTGATPTQGSTVRLAPDGSNAALIGTFGNDTFKGGATTFDTVLENGVKAADATIVRNSDGTVTVFSKNGIDSLSNVDRIRFDDSVVLLTPTQDQSSVAGLYHVAYHRSPDEAGMNFQTKASGGGTSLLQIATNFLNSPEASALALPSLSNGDFVSMLYQNAFGRTPDSAGFAVQLDALAHGVSRAQLLLNFALSAEQVNLLGGSLKGAVIAIAPDPTLP